jgi:hypothetical protein
MNLRSYVWVVAVVGMFAAGVTPGRAQETNDAKAIVTMAMNAELAADANDHSRWKYKDDQQDLGMVSIVVQTDKGSVKRLIRKGGQTLNAADAKAEDARLQSFIHDPSAMEKQRKDAAQDGKSATELLKMLPEAFLWKVQREDADKRTLHFEPNPNFNPPDMQSRVLGTMVGELVMDR